MTLFKEHAAHKHEKALAEAAADAARHQAVIDAEVAQLRDFLHQAKEFRGYGADQMPAHSPVILKAGELAFAVFSDVALVEFRSGGGQWVGASQGVSVRIPGTRSMRYRIGSTKGHFEKNPEALTIIDSGSALVTTKRVVFAGPKQTREWQWAKCIAIDHDEHLPYTMINVSNRQKSSGLGYGGDNTAAIRFRIDLAMAVENDSTDELVHDIESHLALLEHTSAPVLAATGAAWKTDPTGRHQSRYWDGAGWTEHVADNGRASVDPL